jgi:GH25 family lysozyme M1 (1,4-beta-N-acetylmuramidase)
MYGMIEIDLRVVDIYHNDNVTSFERAADSGIWGIIHKATTGATGKDSEYANRRQPALDAGLLWGAYHWGTNAEVSAQVDNFLSVSKPDATTLVALDFEETEGNQMTLDQAREFLTSVGDALGRKPVLYCGGLFKSETDDTIDEFFGSHRLWLAQYGSNPVAQASWQTYWLWQYTDSLTGLAPNKVDGIPGDSNGNLDCNAYAFTKAQLTEEWAS